MFDKFCEYDINPLVIFNTNGEIEYCNQEAEIFLAYINKKELFEFTIKNAPTTPQIKIEFKRFFFNEFEFTGYAIGYQDESLIGVRLFINTNLHSIEFDELEKVNVLQLIEFAIEYVKLKQNTKFKIYPDPDLPEIYLNKKLFVNLLLEIFENKSEIELTTKLKIGEYIKINSKKYPILSIVIKTAPSKEIKSQFCDVIKKEDGYIIQIPIIKELNENSNS